MEIPNCDQCGKEVKLKDGVLEVDFKEIRSTQEARNKWEKDHPERLLSSIDLLTYPDNAEWKWHHRRCGPECGTYWIDGTRLDSTEKVLHWTFHLMGKTWFEFTDWRKAIERLYPKVWESGI